MKDRYDEADRYMIDASRWALDLKRKDMLERKKEYINGDSIDSFRRYIKRNDTTEEQKRFLTDRMNDFHLAFHDKSIAEPSNVRYSAQRLNKRHYEPAEIIKLNRNNWYRYN